MSDLYAILSVAKTATTEQIRAAYLQKICLIDPAREPERYLQLREAQEILGQAKTRRQYDELLEMDRADALLYHLAVDAMASDEPAKAIRLLKKMLLYYPQYEIVKCKLGEAYLANGQKGKAVDIYEALVRQEPDHAGYCSCLAEAYFERGWYRKAEQQYQQAVQQDQDNMAAWSGWIDCLIQGSDLERAADVSTAALKRSLQSGWDSIFLFKNLIRLDFMLDRKELLRQHLAELGRVIEHHEARENILDYLTKMAGLFLQVDGFDSSEILLDAVAEMVGEDIMRIDQIRMMREKGVLYRQLGQLSDDGQEEYILYSFFYSALEHCGDADCLKCRVSQLESEMLLLINRQQVHSQIKRVRADFPALYQQKAAFLDEMQVKGTYQRLFMQRYRAYDRIMATHPELFLEEADEAEVDGLSEMALDRVAFKNLVDQLAFADEDALDDDDYAAADGFQEPVVRNPDKVGRNDPCPCGSGKKYKKCCGR